MSATVSRRGALLGATAAVAATAVPALPEAAEQDPALRLSRAWYAERQRVDRFVASCNEIGEAEDEKIQAADDALTDAAALLFATPAMTLAGAIAKLRIFLIERHGFEIEVIPVDVCHFDTMPFEEIGRGQDDDFTAILDDLDRLAGRRGQS